jgi:hypothetical protein
MKSRFLTSMKLLAQYVSIIASTAVTAAMLFCVLTWEFLAALFGVVVLGKNEGDLI